MVPFHSSKQFVNTAGSNSDASIFTLISFYTDDSSSCECALKIRDCSHSIHLNIGLSDEGDRGFANSLYKIDVLVDELTRFRGALVKAKIIHDEREVKEKIESEKHLKELKTNGLFNEMDSGNNNAPIERSLYSPPLDSNSGLEDLQAAIFAVPNV